MLNNMKTLFFSFLSLIIFTGCDGSGNKEPKFRKRNFYVQKEGEYVADFRNGKKLYRIQINDEGVNPYFNHYVYFFDDSKQPITVNRLESFGKSSSTNKVEVYIPEIKD